MCPDPSLLDALATGLLAPDRRAEIEAHVDACADCSAVLAELARIYGSRVQTIDPLGPTVAGERLVSSAPPPANVGRYVLGERLGEGGMGVVFVAHDPELDRRVAVKLLHPDPSGDLDAQRQRLMREAQAMAKLSHPNVVAVHDVGRVGDRLFLAMELVEGTTLSSWLHATPRTRAEIVSTFVQAGRGLAAAHAVGLVHRDFKPDNVLVGVDGRARVTDFGLARPGTIEAPGAGPLSVSSTQTAAFVGTPAYMAPEQLRGEPADARSDQFSFCVALYEALFGARPFAGTTLRELSSNVLQGRIRPMPSAPRWLRVLLARGLAVDPAARFPSMDALLAELGRDHGRARRIALVAAAVATGTAAIVASLHAATSSRTEASSPLAPQASQAPPTACDDVRIEVRETWTAARKKDVSKAFTAATRYWARDLDERVIPVLDRWANDWAAARRATCNASDPPPRLACLDDRLQAFDALIVELGRADPKSLVFALPASEHLPPAASCNDGATLSRRPAMPADASKVSLIEKRLHGVFARIELGHAREARDDAEKLVSEAKASGHEPTHARALWLAGRAALHDEDEAAAKDLLSRAVAVAQAAKLGDVAMHAAIDLVWLHGTMLDDDAEADRWARVAESEAKREGGDRDGEAQLLTTISAWKKRRGLLLEARDAAKRALALREKRLGGKHGDVAASLATLAMVLVDLDEPAEAEALAERATKLVEQLYGKEHPHAGGQHAVVGHALFAAGKYEDALVQYERARRVRTDALDMYDPLYAEAIADAARALVAIGKYAEADKQHTRALGLRREILRPDHPDVARSLVDIGVLRLREGKKAEGVEKHREAVAHLEKVLEADDPRIAWTRVSLGDALLEAGQVDLSIASYSSAVALLDKRFGERSTATVDAKWKLGLALGKKDPAKGLAALDDLVSLVDAKFGHDHPRTAKLATDRARFALATGDKKRAAELLDAALYVLEAARGADHPETKAVRAALAAAK